MTTVTITDVTPKIFYNMLGYVYGKTMWRGPTKDMINACDKYGVVHLKLEAEAAYVKFTEITMDNMMENLLYADSKNLALLKEAVMDFIVANKKRVMGKISFEHVPGSTVSDILAAMARGEPDDDDDSSDDDEEDESRKYNTMRVGTLRQMLDERGLDVDGSREILIATLKEAEMKEGSVLRWAGRVIPIDSDSE